MKDWQKELGRFALIGIGSVVLGKVRTMIPKEFEGYYSVFVGLVVVFSIAFVIKYGFKKWIVKSK
jgi:hypothetical protein